MEMTEVREDWGKEDHRRQNNINSQNWKTKIEKIKKQ